MPSWLRRLSHLEKNNALEKNTRKKPPRARFVVFNPA